MVPNAKDEQSIMYNLGVPSCAWCTSGVSQTDCTGPQEKTQVNGIEVCHVS